MAQVDEITKGRGVRYKGDTEPTSGMATGDTWYDTANEMLKYYSGTAWKVFALGPDKNYTAGYAVAGQYSNGPSPPTGAKTTIEKLTFASETYSVLTSGLEVTSRWNQGGYSWGRAGYVAGGAERASSIGKVDFGNDSYSVLVATLSDARAYSGAFESSSMGFCGGANAGSGVTTIDKLAFSTESNSVVTSNLVRTTGTPAGAFSSTVAGYFCGGDDNVSVTFNTIQKLLFDDESVSTNTSGLTRDWGASVGFESSSAGYIPNGATRSNTTWLTVNKLTFSSESIATGTSNLQGTCIDPVSGFASSAEGFVSGGTTTSGNSSTNHNKVHKLTFSNDNTSTSSATLSISKHAGIAGFES